MHSQQQAAAWGGVRQQRAGLEADGLEAVGFQAAGHEPVRHEPIGLEAIVDTVATLRGAGESLAELAHDARNMVTALGLYCDLLEEPGVLAPSHRHYGSELRLVAAASRRLVEKMVLLDAQSATPSPFARREPRFEAGLPPRPAPLEMRPRSARMAEMLPPVPINDLAAELMANRNLLAALAGPGIALTVTTHGGGLAVRLTGEDLTRVLVNLVKNAAQAMPVGGRIHLSLHEFSPDELSPDERLTTDGHGEALLITMEDSGPGIPPHALDQVFEAGFSTLSAPSATEGWPATHRGLGLSITRSIVEAAGCRVHASNGDCAAPRLSQARLSGARISIELPVRKR
jgi:signal transduction histidine kinase